MKGIALAKAAIPTAIYYSASIVAKKILAIRAKHKNAGAAGYIDRTVQVLGWNNVRIGRNSVISEGGWLNVNHRQGAVAQIAIEDNCYIGRRNFFSSGRLIRIGSYCLTGIDCKFIGANHDYSNPFLPYISTGTTDEDTIDIGVNCWLGANVSVVGSSKVGHGSVIGANALIIGNIPSFSLVIGSPGRVIKRFNVIIGKWIDIENYDAEMEAKLPSEAEYVAKLNASHPTIQTSVRSAGRNFGDLP